MELYAVKIIKTGKYILWCDECWYETTTDSTPKYSYDRAREITEQMKTHYCYDLDIVSNDGKVENVCHLASLRRKKAIKAALESQQAETGAKKKFFSMNCGMMNKVTIKKKIK